MELTLDTNIQYLKGVGEKRAALYQKLHIFTVRDLFYHFPRGYVDLSAPYTVMDAPESEPCAIRARLVKKFREQRLRHNLSIFKLLAEDETGPLHITMFNCGWTIDGLKPGEEYIFYGKASGGLPPREMASPDLYAIPENRVILPVYPQTAGISSKMIRGSLEQCLEESEPLPEIIPAGILLKYGFPEIEKAIRHIHFPLLLEDAKKARERFVFEELLVLSLGLSLLNADNAQKRVAPMQPRNVAEFYESLPFSPTNAQCRCVDEAVGDMLLPRQMNRLLQGDVGSGKTLVAAACIWFAYRNGRQSAVMAPTEILAEQHYGTMQAFLRPFHAKIALLTGSTAAKERNAINNGLLSGEIDCVVGTHALLSEGVVFSDLGLVVTDEQHRFGVAQRAKLSKKNDGAHVLVMSATPIPRTLSLLIYGDLRLSVLDEAPSGRKKVETLLISGNKRARAMGFVRDALLDGRQAYIVCPLVEQGEALPALKPAVEYEKQLAETGLKGFKTGLLHGKMKPSEKERVMRGFKNGEIQALVSTTVVEVGVDVPNATIILIENAERFGLSQLHQLRGRVGRGAHKSWCILVSDSRSPATRERLSVLKETSDGFKIAEHDLKQRGPGDFFGFRQHGLPALKIASLADDMAVMQWAGDAARLILQSDPKLESPQNAPLKLAVHAMMEMAGDRPN